MTTILLYSGDKTSHNLRRDVYKLLRDRGTETKLKIISDYDLESGLEYGEIASTVDYYVFVNHPPTDPAKYYDPTRTLVFRNVLNSSQPEYVEENQLNSDDLDKTYGVYDTKKYLAVIDNCPLDYVVTRTEKAIKAHRCGIMLDGIMCITLEGAHDRQRAMKEEFDKYDLDVDFYVAKPHTNPKFGCLQSHLAVLEIMKEKGWDNMLILEDDCFFARGFQIPTPPSDWEMLYLGSSVNTLLEKYNQDWNRVCTWLTHAYVVNYKILDILIENIQKLGVNYNMTIDDLYCQVIHPKHRCYAVYPTIAIQREGYSNIERTKLNRLPQIEAADKVINIHIKKPKWIGDVYFLESYEMGKYEKEAVRKEFTKRNIEYRRMENMEMILRDAIRRKLKNVLILSGEVHINKSLYDLYYYPADYDMLYLGDNTSLRDLPQDVLNVRTAGIKGKEQDYNTLWRKVGKDHMCDTFAILLQEPLYEKILNEYIKDQAKYPSLPYYLANVIHPNFQCYLSNEEYVQNKVILEDPNEDKDKVVPHDKLPSISVITPTGNRQRLFRMAIMNFLAMDYPREKVEWIIVDDGDEPMDAKFLPKDKRVRYFYINQETKDMIYKKVKKDVENEAQRALDHRNKMKKDERKMAKLHLEFFNKVHVNGQFNKNRLPVGLKRNMGVKYASNDVLVHMDDDDFYPIKSTKYRVSRLQMLREVKPSMGCVASTAIATFDINNYISTINIPPMQLPPEQRVSEATMCYTRDFWNKAKFDNVVVSSEGELFIKNRLARFYELDYHEYENNIIVALHHRNNLTRTRRIENQQSNGWHFGEISEQLFQFITTLDVDPAQPAPEGDSEGDGDDELNSIETVEGSKPSDNDTKQEAIKKLASERTLTKPGTKAEVQAPPSSQPPAPTINPDGSQSSNLRDMLSETISKDQIEGSMERAEQILAEGKNTGNGTTKSVVDDYFTLNDDEMNVDIRRLKLE